MPSFFGYMLWSGGILVPLFIVMTFIWFGCDHPLSGCAAPSLSSLRDGRTPPVRRGGLAPTGLGRASRIAPRPCQTLEIETYEQTRILVARAIFLTSWTLREHFDVEANPDDVIWTQQELAARLADKDGVLTTGSQRVDAALLAAAPRLKICANMAVGYNNFDVDAMTAAGVQGTNTPDVLTETTADWLCIALDGHGPPLTESEHFLRAGSGPSGAMTCLRAATSTAARWASSAWGASAGHCQARRARFWHEG